MSQAAPSQIAPGRLEEVRQLLNTWWIPNDTRRPQDDLQTWLAENQLSDGPRGSVRLFRDELRRAVEDVGELETVGNGWIDRYRIEPTISGDQVTFRGDHGVAGDLAVVVLEALQDGSMKRLKACPDCRWVFYDNTRNGSKRWCMMNPTSPDARGCGNIAKARRHRARKRQASQAG
ncbi:MAG: CGNR zinc finger domain-containing protein [Acidimicrobiia bacterium]